MSNVFLIDQDGYNNTLTVNADAVFNNSLTVDGYKIDPTNAVAGQALVYDGYAYTATNISGPRTVASVSNLSINVLHPSTQTVFSYTPSSSGSFIFTYYYITTATVSLDFNFSYTDDYASRSILLNGPGATTVSGFYMNNPIYFYGIAGQPIILTADVWHSGEQNNLKVYANLIAL